MTDLLELKAIQSVYRSGQHVPLGIGSIKPNIGHPLCAEGIASFIKVVLMLKHKQTVPFLSGDEPMPHFDITKTDFHFHKTAGEWDAARPSASINCFADGGTNAHVILEAWEEKDTRMKRKPLPVPSLRRKALVKEPDVRAEKQELPAKKCFGKHLNERGVGRNDIGKINISLDHPIMKYMVFGEAVLPGLAYIDLIYQVFQEHGYVYNELELKHVTIYQPLTVSETAAIILTIQCSDSGDGKWLISLSGQKQQGDELSDNIQYATAEMVKRDAVTFDETIDFGDVKQSGRSLNLDDMYNRCLDHDLVHSGMMKSNGRLYETEGGMLAELSCEEGKDFFYSILLLDASGIGASGLLSETNRLHLPLYYESFTTPTGCNQSARRVSPLPASVRKKNSQR